jgi:Right handed beta helix region
MSSTRETVAFFAGLLLFGIASSSAWAQATRTFVSGVGDDANPCSRTAPCKTFAVAIGKTASGGEVNAIDAGDFGPFSIAKSITIDGGGAMSTVTFGAGGAVVVVAGANDVVVLRNLTFNASSSATLGILFGTGGALYIDNVHIFGARSAGGLDGTGIDFNPSGNSRLYVSNSSIRKCAFVGIHVRPTGTGSADVSLSRVHLEKNATGLFVSDGAAVSVVDSMASSNAGAGFQVFSSVRPAELYLERSVSSNNGTFGVRTDGAPSIVRLSNTNLVSNFVGISAGGGSIVSFSNNAVAGNTGGDGAPTSTVALK